MFHNYFAAALRNLVRNRLYAAINIIGLAVGFAAALLIALFVRDELSYDTWLPAHERTFLLRETLIYSGRTPIESQAVPTELADSLKLHFPDIESITRVVRQTVSLRRGDTEATERVFWADPTFFDVLQLPVAFGDTRGALARPDGIVLTRRVARKYFGRDDVLGETLEINRQNPMRVAAVIEDLPSNTHLDTEIIGSGLAPFNFLAQRKANPLPPSAWNSVGWTYMRLASTASQAAVDAEMPTFVEQRLKEATLGFSRTSLYLLPLSKVHMDPENSGTAMKPTTDPNVVYGLSATGVLILVIAAINFVNLMTARATRRAVEVGVRKSTGAMRRNLIIQFVGESLLYAGVGAALALSLVALIFPAFNAFLDRTIGLHLNAGLAAALLAVVLSVGVAAGVYPAFVMSAFRPAAVLKNAALKAGGSGRIRQTLVVFQFALLIALVVSVAVIYRQTAFAMKDGLRLDKDQIVVVTTQCKTAFPDRVRALPGVKAAACSGRSGLELENANSPVRLAGGAQGNLTLFAVDFGYLDLYGLSPLAGRFFDRTRGADSAPTTLLNTQAYPPLVPNQAIVINESALRHLGFKTPEAAIGQSLIVGEIGRTGARAEIVGVVRDFSLDSIYHLVAASMYYVLPPHFNYLTIKLTGRDLPETIAAIDQAWKETGEPRPIRRVFLDQEVEKMYQGIIRQSYLFSTFGGIALLIAALGLFGLAAFTAEQRTKEIGIRKAMGARTVDILGLLLWQFTKPVLWANLIAWPVGYFVMRRWLEDFAYHIDLAPWMFLAASALAVVIAVLTVVGHALLVARAQPVTALRYE